MTFDRPPACEPGRNRDGQRIGTARTEAQGKHHASRIAAIHDGVLMLPLAELLSAACRVKVVAAASVTMLATCTATGLPLMVAQAIGGPSWAAPFQSRTLKKSYPVVFETTATPMTSHTCPAAPITPVFGPLA
jgi:hypothetical protein